jgi:DEAD/DEAH box helicase domain-containing protein
MNLSLGLELAPRAGGVEASIARFEQWMTIPDSPIRAIRHQPARDGEYAEIPEAVVPALRTTLEQRGIPRLYVHQADAFQATADGKNVVIVTPTASGKTGRAGYGSLTLPAQTEN